MDHLVPATVAEDSFDFTALAAADLLRIACTVSAEAAAEFLAAHILNKHAVAALEVAVDLLHARREQAFALRKRGGGAGVDADAARRFQRAGDPTLARRGWRCRRDEPGAARPVFNRFEWR